MINSEKYCGGFKDNLYHGHGTFYFENKDVFEGEYTYGDKTRGKYTFSKTGDVYIGEFAKNRFSTLSAEYIWASQQSYIGEFIDGEISGTGKFFYSDGSTIEGRFMHNMKHGPMLVKYKNGDKFEGIWANDTVVGSGSFKFNDGFTVKV